MRLAWRTERRCSLRTAAVTRSAPWQGHSKRARPSLPSAIASSRCTFISFEGRPKKSRTCITTRPSRNTRSTPKAGSCASTKPGWEWFGYTEEEAVGVLRFTDLMTPEGVEQFRAAFESFKERGWAADLEYEVRRKDGTLF